MDRSISDSPSSFCNGGEIGDDKTPHSLLAKKNVGLKMIQFLNGSKRVGSNVDQFNPERFYLSRVEFLI